MSANLSTKPFAVVTSLMLTNAAMIVFVVLEGHTLPTHSYMFSIVLAVASALVFFAWALVTTPVKDLCTGFNGSVGSWRRSGVLGFFWALNFQLLLQANPHTPPIFQTLIQESSIPVTVLFSYLVLGVRFHWTQMLAALAVFAGAVIPIAGYDTSSDTYPNAGLWCFVFFLGTAPIAIANIFTEFLVKLRRVGVAGSGSTTPSKEFAFDIAWGLGWANVWIVLFLLLLFWTPWLPFLDDLPPSSLFSNVGVGLRCIFTGENGYENQPDPDDNDSCTAGSLFLFGVVITSILATAIQPILNRQESAVYSTLVITIAPFLSTVMFFIKPIMDPYGAYDPHSAESPYTWVGCALVVAGTVGYKVASTKRPPQVIVPTSWTRFMLKDIEHLVALDNSVNDLETSPLLN